jgi:hypothetical protein
MPLFFQASGSTSAPALRPSHVLAGFAVCLLAGCGVSSAPIEDAPSGTPRGEAPPTAIGAPAASDAPDAPTAPTAPGSATGPRLTLALRGSSAPFAHADGLSGQTAIVVDGDYDNVQALSRNVRIDGATRDRGWYRYTFLSGGASLGSLEGAGGPTPAVATSGGVTLDTSGPEAFYTFGVDAAFDASATPTPSRSRAGRRDVLRAVAGLSARASARRPPPCDRGYRSPPSTC